MKKIFKGALLSLLTIGIFSASSSFFVEALGNLPKEKFNPEYYNTEIPNNYYDNVNVNLVEEEFRDNLYETISKDYNPHSYKENNTTITYTDVDPDNPNNVIGFYSGRSLNGGWNKEHVWAKSHGFPGSSTLPYCDAHHLRPTLNHINSTRSNYDFGEILDGAPDEYGNKCNREVFEPRDEVKGDVARIMFYMATRYGRPSGFNLKLVTNKTTKPSESNGRFGGLNTLLKWHYNDPVSKEEIYRNNAIYYLFQNNRNPYIDHPEWVDLAYPSEYSNQEVNEEKVLKVIDLINLIPKELIRPDKHFVMSVNDAYFKLNFNERKLVSNYNILKDAIEKVHTLEEPLKPTNPDKPGISDIEGAKIIDFSKNDMGNFGYTNNETTYLIDGVSITASASGKFNDYIRFGGKSVTLPTKFGGKGGASVELNVDICNLKSFGFTTYDTYGDIEALLYLSLDGGVSYEPLPYEFNYEGSSVELSEPVSGRIALVFKGSNARVELKTISILTEENVKPEPEPNPDPTPDLKYDGFKDELAGASIKIITDKSGNFIDAKLRFGGAFNKDLYNSNAKYGVILVADGDNLSLNPGLQEITSLDTLAPNRYKEGIVRKYSSSLYDITVDIDEIDKDKYLTCYMYMEIDGKIYLSKSIKASFNDVKNRYISENKIRPEYIELLNKIK